jgi:hypothetical protein
MPRTEVATGQAAASSEDCRIERVSREWRASVDLAKPAAGRLAIGLLLAVLVVLLVLTVTLGAAPLI